ncbi:MAG: hypothetical protein KJ621_04260 [Proteobacteria bacterium]|nr:hypothetical protein [Pseudomonadota bacterium]MBU1740426.1 hypothetical protein [Pseudomonadota bacterium]
MSSKTLITTLILAAVIAVAVLVGLKFFHQVRTIPPSRGALSQGVACLKVLPPAAWPWTFSA